MKVTIVSRSDSTGGAAIVSRRLCEALRQKDVRAGMLVLDKKTDLPYVVEARYPIRRPLAFLRERAQIFLHNHFSMKNLWKVDTAAYGLPLWEHPMILESDAIILNWVNQGMLSLEGIGKMCPPGKKVIWTMHDMWNLTGICHHAMECRHYEGQCGRCPFLNSKSPGDLSHTTWLRKERLYREAGIHFVAVSNWLADRARESSLMKDQKVTVIHNPYPNPNDPTPGPSPLWEGGGNGEAAVTNFPSHKGEGPGVELLFAAASLDNWIKGLDTFKESIRIFKERFPRLAAKAKVVLMGAVKKPESIEGFALPVDYKGVVSGEEKLAEVYAGCDVIVNSSHFENLPGTLVEGQAYGAVPVAFDRGGQSDIIDNGDTGFLVKWDDNEARRAENLAEGIAKALKALEKDADGIRRRMRRSVEERFSYSRIADAYMQILNSK